MKFDSKEEEYFYWWISELTSRNIIAQVKYQPKPFRLFNGIDVIWEQKLKTKIKEKKVSLLKGHEYQADFLFYWNEKAHNIMFADYADILDKNIKTLPFVANYSEARDTYFSVVDVKGTFNQNDAWRRFSIDQKWVFQNFGIYVQKIIPYPNSKGIPGSALFPRTFIPRRFQLTDKGRKKRKVHFRYRFIEEYLEQVGLG